MKRPRVRPTPKPSTSVFKRRRFAARHRRPSLLPVVLRSFALALAIVGTPVALVAWSAVASHFHLRHLDVEVTPHVDREWIRQQVRPFAKSSLPWLSLSRVARQLERHPWIDAVALEKQLPGTLRIAIALMALLVDPRPRESKNLSPIREAFQLVPATP